MFGRYGYFANQLDDSGTGYIGSFTALALLEADYEVVVVDNLYNSSEEALNRIELICGKRPYFHNIDVRDEAAIDNVFDAHPQIDSVIHFAALKVSRSGFNCAYTIIFLSNSSQVSVPFGDWRRDHYG